MEAKEFLKSRLDGLKSIIRRESVDPTHTDDDLVNELVQIINDFDEFRDSSPVEQPNG